MITVTTWSRSVAQIRRHPELGRDGRAVRRGLTWCHRTVMGMTMAATSPTPRRPRVLEQVTRPQQTRRAWSMSTHAATFAPLRGMYIPGRIVKIAQKAVAAAWVPRVRSAYRAGRTCESVGLVR